MSQASFSYTPVRRKDAVVLNLGVDAAPKGVSYEVAHRKDAITLDLSAKPVLQLVITEVLEEDADPKATEDKLVELYKSLNDYCLTKYGKGLAISQFRRFVAAEVPTGVTP